MISYSIDNESNDDFKPVEEKFSKYSSAVSAARLISKHSISWKKAAIICKSLKDGVDIALLTQVGVWKHVIKEAEPKNVNIKAILQSETFCLHFDGKVILKTEYQVVCLQNEDRLINLGILTCKNGSSRAIFKEIKTLMDEYDVWKSIKMIVCDTTAVNTGKENGVVVNFQKAMSEKGYEKPQFIGCQHHILDLVLRYIMDFQLGGSTRSPQLPYNFINEITNNYKVLKANYEHDSELLLNENPGWRDDFRFLYQLCLRDL